MTGDRIIFFDGVCNLCNASVRFIIRHDPEKKFRFLSLQDPRAKELLPAADLPQHPRGTFVLLKDNLVFTRSDAALRVARELKGPVRFLSLLRIVPRFIRDALYDFVAKNRYRWFGKNDQCSLPSPETKDRFI